ncbi:hypothetical protein XELAEV_18022908mg [Xenopus laevis]|uniref:Uncharacterized protein n=1 Tax=Xenopus laevis TaxID=8355 RepID=A0A974HNL1_XENLA|nr:hypothetical protein XELAEV_18022908mg [Xenopus laevis]
MSSYGMDSNVETELLKFSSVILPLYNATGDYVLCVVLCMRPIFTHENDPKIPHLKKISSVQIFATSSPL